MWSRGDIRPPLEPSGPTEEMRQQDSPSSPLFPRKELIGSRHYSTFSPPVASVCTPKYKRKIREANPFVTPATGIPQTPSIWPKMTSHQNQYSTFSAKPKLTSQPAESARSAKRVTKVHIQAMRRGSGEPRRIEEGQMLFPGEDLTRSPLLASSSERNPFGAFHGSGACAADFLTPILPMKTPLPISNVNTAGRIHRRASTGMKCTIDFSMTGPEHDSSVDIETPGRPKLNGLTRDDDIDSSCPSREWAPVSGAEEHSNALLDAEAAIDRQLATGEITEELRKELDIPTNLPKFSPSAETDSLLQDQYSKECLTMPFADFATLFLIINGMPLEQHKMPDGTHKISLYTGDCRQLFEEREKEFNASFDRARGEASPFSKAALWFSRNTVCQRCDTQITSCFTKYGEIAIQTQLLNHLKGGVKRRNAVSNCFKTLDNLHQKCDQSKYDEKRRIQNLMRRVAECIMTVFVTRILANYNHPELTEVKTCFEELDYDEDSLIWCLTMSFKFSVIIFGCFWDWMALHDLLSGASEAVQLDVVRAALEGLKVFPSELSDTDIAEVLQSCALPSSDRQMEAFLLSEGNLPPATLTRNQFARSLSRVPFNHPDFQLSGSEDFDFSVIPFANRSRPYIEPESRSDSMENLMQGLLSVADLLTKTILDGVTSDPTELDLVKKRVAKTYNSPGTATECQKALNIRSSDFITQDFLTSFIVSYEEIQLMLAASPYIAETPLILSRPTFPSIKMINLAMQLMVTCVTLTMTPSERYALRNPMGPLAVNVNEAAIVARAEKLKIPLPPIETRERRIQPSSESRETLSASQITDEYEYQYSALRVPRNYNLIVESSQAANARTEQQRSDSLARLIDGPKLKQRGGESTALSWSSRPAMDFEVRSDDDVSDNPVSHDQVVKDTITQLRTMDARKCFILLNSAECLIESARIIISGVKSFPTPGIPLDDESLIKQGNSLASEALHIFADPERWREFWIQHSKDGQACC